MMVSLAAFMVPTAASAQTLVDARALGLGAYAPVVSDTREFSSNPAGLVRMRDWDMSVSTYLNPGTTPSGFVFHGLTLGKRFYGTEAVALRYTPGSSIRFVIPPVLILGEAFTPESNDREIAYNEQFAFAYAHRFTSSLSAGIGVRVRQEEVTDTRYQIIVRDTISFPAATRATFTSDAWLIDASVMWTPGPSLTVSAGGRNLLNWKSGASGAPISDYALPTKPSADFGIAYEPTPRFVAVCEATTSGTGGAGVEWTFPFGCAVRGGIRWDARVAPMIDALSIGIGWSYQFFEVDAGYMRFTNRHRHDGTSTVGAFDPGLLTDLDVHPYALDRVALSAKAVFGNVRQSLARIEGVTILGSVYPASAEVLAYKPIGTVRVRNISSQPIHARASIFVERVMDAPTESPATSIAPGAVVDIPLMAVFNEQVKKTTALSVREGDVCVNATPAEQYDDRSQTRLVILGRNAWDGDSRSLRYFVAPDDPAVLRYSRDVLLEHRDSLTNATGLLERFAKARVLINSFAGKLLYVNDPKLSADFVQYPSETLQLRGGDCDDLTVCFSSLLGSIGLSTAFVDVIPPDHPENSHIYLLCDTGVEPRFGAAISPNPKRYVVRRNASGVETIWIPLETTVAAHGFDEAWSNGAQEYFDDVEVGLGLVKGWVRIVDVN
jgi:hypothetical protein